MTTAAGTSNNGAVGGAGTVYVKGPGSTYGDLTVDNKGKSGQPTDLPSLGNGRALAGSSETTLVTDRTVDVPAYAVGQWIDITSATGTLKGTWRVTGVSAKTITLIPNAMETVNVAVGDSWRGVYRLDNLIVRSSKLQTADRLAVTNTIDKDAGSQVIFNQGPPVVDISKISVTASAVGPTVIGTAGAVVDPDKPVTVTVTNVRTNVTSTATVNSDGSFAAPVSGLTGDSVTLKARDSHVYPLETSPVTVGTLTSDTPAATQVNQTAWTSDTSFHARTLAINGSMLVATSRAGAGDSDKVVLFDASVPQTLTFKQTVAAGNGRIWDVALKNGYAYVACDDLRIINFNVNPAQVYAPNSGTAGESSAVATDGTYAFVATTWGDGRIQVLDVTNPAAARETKTFTLEGGVTYEHLLLYGSQYLIGISASTNGAGEHDVVVIDRSDINNLRIVKQLAIPNISARRGRIDGHMLYVHDFSTPTSPVAIVDLTDPTNPLLKAVTTVVAYGVDASGTDLMAANADGLTEINVTNPAAPVTSGTINVGSTGWDVVLNGGYAYVGNDTGIAIVPAPTAPRLFRDLITVSRDPAGARVTGAKGSVSGTGSITLTIRDTTTAASIDGIAVGNDGSFSGTIPAGSGDTISLVATDASGRKSVETVVGAVPFGDAATTTFVTPAMANNDFNFRARQLVGEGNTLVTASRVTFGGLGDSDRVVRFDISQPGAPVYKETVNVGNNRIWDIAYRNGYAYVACDDFRIVNFNVTPAQVYAPNAGNAGESFAVATDGTYAFVATNWNDGRIQVLDVTTPSAARETKTFTLEGGVSYEKLIPYGKYLVALTPSTGGGIDHDVTIIDRSDINNLRIVKELPIANFAARRGRIVGTTLYAVDMFSTPAQMAIVDLTDPLNPILKKIVPTRATAFGADVSGNTIAVGDAAVGVTVLDATDPTQPRILGSQPVGGTAWEPLFMHGALYVTNETGVAVVPNVVAPPTIATALVTVSRIAAGGQVTGVTGAITGVGTLTVDILDKTSGLTLPAVAVQADGSFASAISANSGDTISLIATDAGGRRSVETVVGAVPFGGASATTLITPAMANSDFNFRARQLVGEGNTLVTASRVTFGGLGDSDRLVRFDISQPGAPVYKETVNVGNNRIWDIAYHNGYAYVACDDFRIVNFNVSPAQVYAPNAGNAGESFAVATDGTYAFVATNWNDGRIQVLDVTTPSAARETKTFTLESGVSYEKLIPYGKYLVALTPSTGGNVDHDVTIIDRSDINNLRIVKELPIANFAARRGRIVGTTLYVVDMFSTPAQVAIVDLTDPLNPILKKIAPSNDIAFGADASGNNMVVGDGAAGVTFFDATDPTQPRILGSQPVGGTAWEPLFMHGALYVANETGVAVVPNVVAPPTISIALVTVSRIAAGGQVTGVTGAITGVGTLTVDILDKTSGMTLPAVAVQADGSFTGTISANPGDTISLIATDAGGRRSVETVVGAVPFGGASATTLITPAMANNDFNFRARQLVGEGNTLLTAARPTFGTLGDSDRLVRFDISQSGAPVYKETVNVGNNRIWDIAYHNGYAYVACDDFRIVNFNVSPAAVYTPNTGNAGESFAVAVDGTYAFVATNWNDGRIQVLDVTTPSAARETKTFTLESGVSYEKLIPYGKYLVALTPSTGGGVDHDVTIIDRSDVNNLRIVKELPIANFAARRGRIVGNMLYAVDMFSSPAQVAIVDLTDPLNPILKKIAPSRDIAFGVDASGNNMVVGDGAAGVTFFDTTDPTQPKLIGTQPVGGTAWEPLLLGNSVYVANETGVAVIQDPSVAPTVIPQSTTIARASGGAQLTGSTNAAGGRGATTVSVTNHRTAAAVSVPVQAGGTFVATVAGKPGDVLSVQATDVDGRKSGDVVFGQVPFGSAVGTTLVTPALANNDFNFRARQLVGEGSMLITAARPTYGTLGDSDRLVRFDISQPGAPVYKETVNVGNNRIWDIAFHNGYAYVACDDFRIVNFNVSPAVVYTPNSGNAGESYSVAVDGTTAFVSTNWGDGRIQVLDISTPSAPRETKTFTLGGGNLFYEKLIPYGSSYLVALTSSTANGVDHDVTIIDRSDLNNLKIVKELPIANFAARRGKIVGTTLYAVDMYSSPAQVAIVDLTDPLNPVLKKIAPSSAYVFGVDASGTTAAVGDGSAGVTFFDTTNPSQPVLIGTQPIAGNAWEPYFSGTTLYASNETGVVAISNFSTATPAAMTPVVTSAGMTNQDGTAPSTHTSSGGKPSAGSPSRRAVELHEALIGVAQAGANIMVSGAAGAVTGTEPLTVTIHNESNGGTLSNVAVAADGSFSALLVGAPGDTIAISAADGDGISTTTVTVGVVPSLEQHP
jgi:hypothetical protein